MEIEENKVLQEKNFKNTDLTLNNRTKLNITGVEKVYETNENKIQLKVSGDNLQILGENLNIAKLELETGLVQVDGKINELKFYNCENKGNFLKKLFK